MESLLSNAAGLPPPSPPPFHFTRFFKRRSDFRRILSTPKPIIGEELKPDPESFIRAISAICEAVDQILNHQTIPKQLGTELEGFKRHYSAFRELVPILRTLGLTSDKWIGEHTQDIVVLMVHLLSTTIVHTICLLHQRWLYFDVKRVRRTHDVLNEVIPEILEIKIPWVDYTLVSRHSEEIATESIRLTRCQVKLGTDCFGDLQKLLPALIKTKAWESLTWESRYDNLLRARFLDIGKLLQRAKSLCDRSKWIGLMLPLPSRLANKLDSIVAPCARADFHVQWIKSEIMLSVATQFARFYTDFSLDEKVKPGIRTEFGDPGRWLISSEQYQCWYNSAKGTTKRFLWCIGGLAMGKSVLMDRIVRSHRRDWAKSPTWLCPLAVQIHFRANNIYHELSIMQALLQQVLAQTKSPTNLVVSTYESLVQDFGAYPDQDLALALLQELTETYTTYFFLDGLDECDPVVAEKFIRLLTSLGPSSRVICFSRRTSHISSEVYPQFTFMEIQAHRMDIEPYLLYISSELDAIPGHPLSSPDTRSAAIDQIITKMEGIFLFLEQHIQQARYSAYRNDFFNRLNEIPDRVCWRFEDTLLRISRTPDGHDIKRLIAWVAVKNPLSISKDIPHLQSQFSAPDLLPINRWVLDSLGILHIVDGDSVTFTTHIAEGCILSDFSELFPTFISDVRHALDNGNMKDTPEDLSSSFVRFEAFSANPSRPSVKHFTPAGKVLTSDNDMVSCSNMVQA